jgi:deoxyribonuclease V
LAKEPDISRLDSAEVEFFSSLQTLVHAGKKPLAQPIHSICGTDAAYAGDRVVAVACVLVDGELSEQAMYEGKVTFPYSSGLFYLREGPPTVAAVRQLSEPPQLLCLDGHGMAHPRFAGMANTVGAVLRVPSIGIAKSRLVGSLEESRDGIDPLTHGSRIVGYATRLGGPLRYWSPGYSVGLRELRLIILRYGLICLKALAESHRLAHQEIRKCRG